MKVTRTIAFGAIVAVGSNLPTVLSSTAVTPSFKEIITGYVAEIFTGLKGSCITEGEEVGSPAEDIGTCLAEYEDDVAVIETFGECVLASLQATEAPSVAPSVVSTLAPSAVPTSAPIPTSAPVATPEPTVGAVRVLQDVSIEDSLSSLLIQYSETIISFLENNKSNIKDALTNPMIPDAVSLLSCADVNVSDLDASVPGISGMLSGNPAQADVDSVIDTLILILQGLAATGGGGGGETPALLRRTLAAAASTSMTLHMNLRRGLQEVTCSTDTLFHPYLIALNGDGASEETTCVCDAPNGPTNSIDNQLMIFIGKHGKPGANGGNSNLNTLLSSLQVLMNEFIFGTAAVDTGLKTDMCATVSGLDVESLLDMATAGSVRRQLASNLVHNTQLMKRILQDVGVAVGDSSDPLNDLDVDTVLGCLGDGDVLSFIEQVFAMDIINLILVGPSTVTATACADMNAYVCGSSKPFFGILSTYTEAINDLTLIAEAPGSFGQMLTGPLLFVDNIIDRCDGKPGTNIDGTPASGMNVQPTILVFTCFLLSSIALFFTK